MVAHRLAVHGFEQGKIQPAGCGGGFFERQADLAEWRELELRGVVEKARLRTVERFIDIAAGGGDEVEGVEHAEIDASVGVRAQLDLDARQVIRAAAFQRDDA